LRGGDGNDWLFGGRGNDLLDGGDGHSRRWNSSRRIPGPGVRDRR
jgi:Ca2+-binding RTX toxin-like protein